jgi:EmrB/QacA subfamily drug resistance transporter
MVASTLHEPEQSLDVAALESSTGPRPSATIVVLILSAAGLAFSVLQSLVAPALSLIAKDLGTSTGNASWILTAYLLSASVLTPILGRLGDMVGKRRVLLIVLVILAAGTVVSGLATSLPLMIVGRALQGAAGGILPLSIGIVRDELPRERVGIAVGLLSAVAGIGAVVGIIAAGPIVDHLSWQWLFWLPLVLIVLAIVGATLGIPESPVRAPGRLDLVGTGVLSTSLVTLMLAVSKGRDWGWTSPTTLTLLAVGVVAMVAFIAIERRVSEPLINMRLMARRGVWTTNVVGLVVGFALFGTFLLIPSLLELPAATGYGFGKSVTQAGLFLMPTVLMLLVFGPLSGILAKRVGAKVPLVAGSILVALSYGLLAVAHTSLWQVVVSGLLTGAGLGLTFAAMSNAIIDAVPATHTGEAISVNTITRTIGGSIGTSVIAAVISANSTSRGLPLDAAFTQGFWVCAAVAVVGVIAALALPSRRRVPSGE